MNENSKRCFKSFQTDLFKLLKVLFSYSFEILNTDPNASIDCNFKQAASRLLNKLQEEPKPQTCVCIQ